MASGGKDIPQELKEEYERVMALKTERGRSTGKLRDMQRLCKHVYLASTDEGASLQHGCGFLQTGPVILQLGIKLKLVVFRSKC